MSVPGRSTDAPCCVWCHGWWPHYSDVIMGAIASQITSLTIVYSIIYSGADQRKHQSSASLAFVWGIHRGPVNSPYKWPVTRKRIHLMTSSCTCLLCRVSLKDYWFKRQLMCMCGIVVNNYLLISYFIHNQSFTNGFSSQIIFIQIIFYCHIF